MTPRSHTYGSTILLIAIGLFIISAVLFSAPTKIRALSIAGAPCGLSDTTRTELPGGVIECTAPFGTYPVQYVPKEGGGYTAYSIVNGQRVLRDANGAVDMKEYQNARNAVNCSGTWNNINNPGTCIFRAAMAGLGSVLITLSAWILQMVGIMFNYLLYYTVVAFGDTGGFLSPGVLDGIDKVWTVFRDIANILIIGLFTYTAISIILGIKTFGGKAMIAKVLVIAILINFSLLFTKMIVDFSNVFAYQFYNAAGGFNIDANKLGSTSGASGGSALTDFTQDGIAGQFIKYLGVTGIADTASKLSTLSDTANSGWTSLLHGVFGAILLFGTALVLLYGSFLLVSRAILIVFLLVTSSLAFASHLLPSSFQGSYGWGTWWNSLIKTAVFAPLLMMFLWATLQMAAAFNPTNKGTLGSLLDDPTNAGNLSMLFGYVIILGMLYASFKISSSFSSGIAGFNFAAMIPALGLSGASRITGFVGRNSVGRVAQIASKKLDSVARNENSSLIARRLAAFGSQQTKTLSTKDFNAMKTGLGAAVAKTSGLSQTALSGKDIKGYAGTQKAIAEKFAKQAEALAPKPVDQAKALRGAIDAEIKSDPLLSQQHKEATEYHDATKENHERSQGDIVTLQKNHAAEMEQLKKTLQEAQNTGSITAGEAEHAIATKRAQHATAIDEQTQRIKQAKDAIANAHAAVQRVENTAATMGMAKGTIPADGKFKTTGAKEIAGNLVRNRFTIAPFSAAENKEILKLAEEDIAKRHKEHELEETGIAKMIKKIAAEEKKAGGGDAAHTADH